MSITIEVQPQFKCKRCANCCRNIDMLQIVLYDKWREISEYLQEKDVDHITLVCECGCGEEYTYSLSYLDCLSEYELMMMFLSMRCPFIKQEKDDRGKYTNKFRCQIYEIRPEICKEFPTEYQHAKKHANCPGFV